MSQQTKRRRTQKRDACLSTRHRIVDVTMQAESVVGQPGVGQDLQRWSRVRRLSARQPSTGPIPATAPANHGGYHPRDRGEFIAHHFSTRLLLRHSTTQPNLRYYPIVRLFLDNRARKSKDGLDSSRPVPSIRKGGLGDLETMACLHGQWQNRGAKRGTKAD